MGLETQYVNYITPYGEVQGTESTACTNKSSYSIFSNDVKTSEIGDSVHTQNKTRKIDSVYEKIRAICNEYRMSMEDVKKEQLLEKIAGCTTEELLTKTDEELQKIIDALKSALGITGDWTWPWKNRNREDINKIAQDANKRYIYKQTGSTWFREVFRSKNNVYEELVKEGYLTSENVSGEEATEAIKKYFADIIKEAILSGDESKIKKAYAKAKKLFGDLLIDTTDPEQKKVLMAAIAELEASERDLMAELSLASCGNNRAAKEDVAKGISDNYEAIVTQKDATGAVPTQTESTSISDKMFRNMNEKDIQETLDKTYESAEVFFKENGEKLKEIQLKLQYGEELTAEEQELYTKAQNLYYAKYAGANTGIANNEGIEDTNRDTLLSRVYNDTTDLNINNEVQEATKNYIETHPEALTGMSKEEFYQLLNEVKNHNSSNQSEPATENPNVNTNNTATEKQNTQAEITAENTQPKTSSGIGFEIKIDNPVYQNSPIKKVYTSNNEAGQLDQQKNSKDVQTPKTETKASSGIIEAAKSGIKAVKEYFKDKGTVSAITEIFNNLGEIPYQNIIKQAAVTYSNLTDSIQADILKKVGNEGLNELLKYTSDSTLMRLKGETFSNFYATQQVNEAVEEAEEKRA